MNIEERSFYSFVDRHDSFQLVMVKLSRSVSLGLDVHSSQLPHDYHTQRLTLLMGQNFEVLQNEKKRDLQSSRRSLSRMKLVGMLNVSESNSISSLNQTD